MTIRLLWLVWLLALVWVLANLAGCAVHGDTPFCAKPKPWETYSITTSN